MDTVQANVTGKKAGADTDGSLVPPTGKPSPTGGDPITITIRRACELSGLSRITINRLIWAKKLRTTHVGTRHLIYFDSFQEVLGLKQSDAAA
jgi:excisionase family DNA binding protein